jgi:hypothetical protein
MSGVDGQRFGDLQPDATSMWTDRQLRALRAAEERFGDDGRDERCACIRREQARRSEGAANDQLPPTP